MSIPPLFSPRPASRLTSPSFLDLLSYSLPLSSPLRFFFWCLLSCHAITLWKRSPVLYPVLFRFLHVDSLPTFSWPVWPWASLFSRRRPPTTRPTQHSSFLPCCDPALFFTRSLSGDRAQPGILSYFHNKWIFLFSERRRLRKLGDRPRTRICNVSCQPPDLNFLRSLDA